MLLLGKPLLAYTTEAALASKKLARTILSTDDVEIAQIGRGLGIDVPFLRPAELAGDDVPTIRVLQHAVRTLESGGDKYDAVLTLQPTNPLRRPLDIDGAIDLLEHTGADSVISFTDVGEAHPARIKRIDQNGRVSDPPFAEEFEGQPRQQLAKFYRREGSIYLTRRSILMECNSIKGTDCRAWMIPEERSCMIDRPLDLLVAEQLLRVQASTDNPGSRNPVNELQVSSS